MGIFDKLKGAAKGREDKVGQGLDKAGNVVDEKTGGQHSEHIDKGVDAAKGQFGVETGGEAAGEQGGQDNGGQGGDQGNKGNNN